MSVNHSLQPFPFTPHECQCQTEAPHREAHPQCEQLFLERLSWTPEENRIAAAVLGDRARFHLMVARELEQSGTFESDYARGIVHQMFEDAINCAKEAWHYALLTGY